MMANRTRVLVTVGTELPFERLVSAVDRWAEDRGWASDVFAQVGDSDDPPSHIPWTTFVDVPEFREMFCRADLVVSHAGMGTILWALEYRKPLIVMPRRADLGEHRSDHQMSTATRLAALGRVDVALDDVELFELLDSHQVRPKPAIGPYAEQSLIDAVRDFIRAEPEA